MQQLQEGDRIAPDVVVLDAEGRPRALASLVGHGGLLLYFMRSASCVICQAHVRQLSVERRSLEPIGRAIAALVPESPANAALAAKQIGGSIPVLSSGDLYVALGFRRVLFGGIQQSGTVVLDRHGTIARIHRASLPLNALDRVALAAP